MTTTSNRLERPRKPRPRSGKAAVKDDLAARRERIRDALQAEIDKLRPLDETRRAATLIGDGAIVVDEGTAAPGFKIVGPDGQPRMSRREDGLSPFTLADLAADIRERFPALFHPPPNAAIVAQADAAPPMQSAKAEPPAAPAMPPRSTDRGAPGPDLLPRTTAVRPTFVIYAAALLLIAGVLGSLLLGGEDERLGDAPMPRPPSQAAAEPRIPPASPSPTDLAAPAPTAPTPDAPRAVAGVPEVIDTATLRIDRKIARLFGVEWQRGARAEDLTRYIAGRSVACEPVAETTFHRCTIDGRDLSEVVLYNGGGRATDDATPELKAAEKSARENGFGVWQKP
jgi:hypothetical protein